MNGRGDTSSNHCRGQCSNLSTYLTVAKSPEPYQWTRSPYGRDGSDSKADRSAWFPRIVCSYAVTESVHWSQRLDVYDELPAVKIRRRAVEADFYGHEDADAAFLKRKPVSFAVFGKPGLLDAELAAMLSAYWGCVHVSLANGLAAGRADGQTMWELRNGRAVNAAGSATLFAKLLGFSDLEIRERGYVLTGLPRHDPKMSANDQMEAVFNTNPPDVLIYLSCPDHDLHRYVKGIVLESMKHDHLTQTIHTKGKRTHNNHEYIKWNALLIDSVMAEIEHDNYEKHSFVAVEEIVKQFDPNFVITLDGRKPVTELFETIKAKLMTMPLQRTVSPEIVRGTRSENHTNPREIDEPKEYEMESVDMEDEAVSVEHDTGETNGYDRNDHGAAPNSEERNEHIRLMSGLGRLCPVNFFHGLYVLGGDRYRVKYAGKMYFCAGPDEMALFVKHPKRFLEIPTPGFPIRAMFYGPEWLSGPAAKAVSNFYGYSLINVKRIKQQRADNEKQSFFSTVVKSILKTVQTIIEMKKEPSDGIENMRNAIGEWIPLNFENSVELELFDAKGDKSESFDELTEQRTQINDPTKREQLLHLKTYLESYGVEFLNNLEECTNAYKEPETLTKYFQNMSKINRRNFRHIFLMANKISLLELADVIVDHVRKINKNNKNWIIVNAPMDLLLVKKLIDAALIPIQIVFFHNIDQTHEILLGDKMSERDQNKIIQETFNNVKNGIKYGTETERISFPVYEKNINIKSRLYDVEYDTENENEGEFIDENQHKFVNVISHDDLLEIFIPEMTERLNQYTQELLGQWLTLRKHISKDIDRQYMHFNVIECKSGSREDIFKLLIEDSLYYIKRFFSDTVYDASLTDVHNIVPTKGKYNGDTSIYCPVMFAKGKISIGSFNHMAIYQNRYYYMSSLKNLKAFIANPYKYSSFTNPPKQYPKPKICLLLPFGLNPIDLVNSLLNTFDLILLDFDQMFKLKVLPENIPMLGKMYEDPKLKKIMENYFPTENQNKNYIEQLRKYINRESDHLNDEDWVKMNSIFFQSDEGICYKNYPHNLTEFKYLAANNISPDIVIEVFVDKNEERKQATKAVIKNWLTYQYLLIDKVIARDDAVRRDMINKRSILFKKKLAEVYNQKQIDEVKIRLERIIKMIVIETVDGPDEIKNECNGTPNKNKRSEMSKNNFMRSSFSNFSSRYSELTLKQKKIIIEYGLNVDDFLDLNDFTTIERIEEAVNNELPDTKFLISECFSDSLELPSDTMIEQYLSTEKRVFTDMRKFADSSNIPWITVSSGEHLSAVLSDVSKVLVNNDCIFETTFNVDLKTSEKMLCAGEVYLSRFGRWCPVQIYEKSNPVQQFYVDYTKGHIYPVVHRKYVYFLSGSKNRDEFIRQPLKYVLQPFSGQIDLPHFKIAVLGPPKSGKSHYARMLCDRYGFQLIQIKDFVEPYLKAYGWIEKSKTILQKLYRGDPLSDNILIEVVKFAMQTTRSIIQGIVLDGFPTTKKQFKIMNDSGILLHKVFVLNSPYELCLRNNQISSDLKVPESLLRHRHQTWTDEFVGKSWIFNHYGNMTEVNDFEQMEISVETCIESLHEYHANARENRPCSLSNCPVTKPEQNFRMSMYLDLCPVCRVNDNCLNRPRDREILKRNLVQYRLHFYWICPRHSDHFLDEPDKYVDLAPRDPEIMPEVAKIEDFNCNPYMQLKYFSYFCVVCAISCLWDPIYKQGEGDYLAVYTKYRFAFCSLECQCEFMRRPFFYSQYRMNVVGPEEPHSLLPCQRLHVKDLPVMGYLEQTISAAVSSALVELTAIKPIYPGLSPRVSAMMFLGLRIGMNSTDDDVKEYYRDTFDRFVNICHQFKMEVFKLKLKI